MVQMFTDALEAAYDYSCYTLIDAACSARAQVSTG
jgi:hypothetical protein